MKDAEQMRNKERKERKGQKRKCKEWKAEKETFKKGRGGKEVTE